MNGWFGIHDGREGVVMNFLVFYGVISQPCRVGGVDTPLGEFKDDLEYF